MKKKGLFILLITLVLLVVMILPAAAITDGELDGEDHPNVVLILMEEPNGAKWRCSGTLIAPTYVLTAGHCAGAPGEFNAIRIFTESDVDDGDNNYPDAGPNSVEAVRWEAHPDYPYAPFFVHDVGMIELAESISLNEYGTLPGVDQLDGMKTRRGKQDTTFTAVGYGLQLINPVFIQADRVRMVATPRLIQINVPGMVGDFSLLLSNNHSTGGTCFGDSGGPNFLGSGDNESNIVAGVTSFGLNGNCAGTGGVFRMDRQDVQDFVYSFMD